MAYIDKDKALNLDFRINVSLFESRRKTAERAVQAYADAISAIPAADVRPVPEGGIGEMSDGYHTFNGLYYQRMVLFAALVKAHKDKAWKSRKHEDGEPCFGGGWFIVGIDTPDGSYTYHYEEKDFDFFDCKELPVAKHWDGHTEENVTRLLSLPDVRPVVTCGKCKYGKYTGTEWFCDKHSGHADKFVEDASYHEYHSKHWFCADGEERKHE